MLGGRDGIMIEGENISRECENFGWHNLAWHNILLLPAPAELHHIQAVGWIFRNNETFQFELNGTAIIPLIFSINLLYYF